LNVARNAVHNTVEYAQHNSRAHDVVISVYDAAGKVIEIAQAQRRFQRTVSFLLASFRPALNEII